MATGERAAVERITLRDGRSLGYGEFGHPDGKPVFLFHSWLGSRLDAKFLDESAAKAGIRAIGLDRPGMGLSDFQFGRQILDWPEDVIQLADQLGIEQFAVSGVSGGGPYAAACAYKIPQRMTACHIIAGLGPISLGTEGMNTNNRALFFLAQRLPWLLRPVLWLSIGRHTRDEERAEGLTKKVAQQLTQDDRELLARPDIKSSFIEGICESFHQGSNGPAYDGRLYGQPWGFELEDIAFDSVHLWHGERDQFVPVSIARSMAKAIPNCQARFYPNDTHLSIGYNHLEEFMASLLS